ncbi:MAG: C/D box methylation guide ribonucleoprotein complex aNOP56 subunit [Candidatus Methanomethylicota archaeon]|nr:MAG: C/D box methylation guide ribonucleoprotein complex aNOP56 subunit [Candidatus Verstraetearchaeota archaeon]
MRLNGNRGYLIESFFAIFLCDDDGNILLHEKMPKNIYMTAEKLLKLERGEVIEEVVALCNKMRKLNLDVLIVEDDSIAPKLKDLTGVEVKIIPGNDVAKNVRNKFEETALKLGIFSTIKEFNEYLSEISLVLSKMKLREAAEKRDLLVAQSINTIDDVNKTINLLVSRLREWYSIHFPELDNIVKDHKMYVKMVKFFGLRKNFSEKKLLKMEVSSDRVKEIIYAANNSIGANIAEFDVKPIMNFASIIMHLYDMREELEKYIDQTMDEVAPNIKAIVGPLIGARLISLAGGLEELAKLPASTIQVLGAEKALFRALRTGAKPPKHGVIFQCPEVHRAPRWQRGKIARALAGKLTIAARVDAFSGAYMADELKEDLNKRIEEIKRIYANRPKKHAPIMKRKKRSKKKRKRR